MQGRQFWVGPLWVGVRHYRGRRLWGLGNQAERAWALFTHPRWHNSKLSEGRETHYTDENDAHFRVTPLTLLLRFGVFSLSLQRSGAT